MRIRALAVVAGSLLLTQSACGLGGSAAKDPYTQSSEVSSFDEVLKPSDRIRTGTGPAGIAAGFGSLWVSNEDGTVARIDPASGRVIARVRVGTRIAPIAIGEGSVWVASFAGTIYRISPATNAVIGSVRVGPAPNIVAGLGALWVAQGKHLFKLDTSTLKTVDRVSIEQPVGAAPLGDSAPAIWGSSVWVPHSFSKVSRVDGRTLRSHEQEVGSGPRLTSSAGGLWIATYDPAEEKGAVARLSNDGKTELVATGPWNIKHLAVSRTSIWIRTAADSLVEVDRESGAVREFKVRDEGYPGGIDVAFGFLSLANSAVGELWLIPQDR